MIALSWSLVFILMLLTAVDLRWWKIARTDIASLGLRVAKLEGSVGVSNYGLQQERINELGRVNFAWNRAYWEGHPIPCTLGSLCPYCEIERQRKYIDELEQDLKDRVNDIKMLTGPIEVGGGKAAWLAVRVKERKRNLRIQGQRGWHTMKEEERWS